jgi:ubiquinone/menaquinone biosynthesis C-methylase UbiE
VIDLACYVGGPARQLAGELGCEVVGVDISPVHITVAERLTELAELGARVSFLCASADAVPLPDGSFTVAWSQCSFPQDLGWLKEMDRLLSSGGRLAFTGLIRRSWCSDADLPTLDEMSQKVVAAGYRVLCAEDISDMDTQYGWLPALTKLKRNEERYVDLLGAQRVRRARASIEADLAAWREGRMGNGRIVAAKQ